MNIKPLIIVVGAPHSMTSMTIRFLISNDCGSGLVDNKIDGHANDAGLKYSSDEDWLLKGAIMRMRKWKHDKLSDDMLKRYFDILPKDQVITMKSPYAAFFIDKIASYTEKPIKIVYCLRNPHDVFVSTFEKENYKHTFFRLFHLWNSLYQAAVESKYPIFMLPVERLANKDENIAQDLLWFCNQRPYDSITTEINWSTIESKHIKKRKYVYLDYRMSNFIFILIDRIIKRMNW